MRQLIGMAALALAACGGGGEENAEGGNGTAAASGGGSASVSLQPGQWEITTTVASINVPNLPPGATPPLPPPSPVRSCLTPEQAAQPTAGFIAGAGENGGCTYENSSMSGGRIEATVQCNAGGATMRSVMNGQFAPESFEVTQRATTSAEGMNMEMESRTTGRRVGDCPAGG